MNPFRYPSNNLIRNWGLLIQLLIEAHSHISLILISSSLVSIHSTKIRLKKKTTQCNTVQKHYSSSKFTSRGGKPQRFFPQPETLKAWSKCSVKYVFVCSPSAHHATTPLLPPSSTEVPVNIKQSHTWERLTERGEQMRESPLKPEVGVPHERAYSPYVSLSCSPCWRPLVVCRSGPCVNWWRHG